MCLTFCGLYICVGHDHEVASRLVDVYVCFLCFDCFTVCFVFSVLLSFFFVLILCLLSNLCFVCMGRVA